MLGMTKTKMGKASEDENDFLENRKAALERFLVRVAQHPILLQVKPFFVYLFMVS